MANKYAGLESLQIFLENLKNLFAPLNHTHTISEISDYTVDDTLSSISNNPVANATLNAEFDAISEGMIALESAIDDKANSDHIHSYNDLDDKPFYDITDYGSIFINSGMALPTEFLSWGDGVYGASTSSDLLTPLTIGETYKVIWDGQEYELECKYFGDTAEGNKIAALGAPYGDYSEYPFGIDTYMYNSGVCEYDIHTDSTASTHAVDILEYNPRTITLDEKYIPDTIARVSDQSWNLIYDSGAITEAVNSIAGIDISGYSNFQIVVQNVNDGTNKSTAAGSVIFTAQNGTTYMFHTWSTLFPSSSNSGAAGMAHYRLLNGWLMLEHTAYTPSATRDIFSEAEGGSAVKCSAFSGGALMRCTNPLSTMAITSSTQSTSNYFGVGSRVMVWGCKA